MVPSLLLHWAMRLGCIELREEVMPSSVGGSR